MKLLWRGLLAGAAATAAAAAVVIPLTTTANASTDSSTVSNKVVVNTNSYGHMDTTNVNGTATFTSPNGPVWAIDTLREKWTITACSANPACDSGGGANFYVTLNVGPKINGGSHFSEFANPGPNDPTDGITSSCPASGAGGPRQGTGTVTGTISYSVVANAGPDLSSVPPVQPANTGLGTVLSQIFDNATNFATVGATPYDFKYANVCGSVYQQTG